MPPRLSRLQGLLQAQHGLKLKLPYTRCFGLFGYGKPSAPSKNVQVDRKETTPGRSADKQSPHQAGKTAKNSFKLQRYIESVQRGETNSMPDIPLDFLKEYQRFSVRKDETNDAEDNKPEINEQEWRNIDDASQLPPGLREEMEAKDPENELVYMSAPDNTDVSFLSDIEKATLKKLFRWLDLSKNRRPALFRKHVWKVFPIIAAQPRLAKTLNIVAWGRLWEFEEQELPSPRRIVLGELMVQFEKDMTEDQLVKFVEALFWYGRRDDAMQIWQVHSKQNKSLVWWNLGIRMAATENDPISAGKLAEKAHKITGQTDAMTFIPVIVSYLHAAEEAVKSSDVNNWNTYTARALGFYKRLEESGIEVTHKQFTRIAMSFLDAGLFGTALEVHSDLIHSHTEFMNLKSGLFSTLHKITDLKELVLRSKGVSKLTPEKFDAMDEEEQAETLLENWVRYLIHRQHLKPAMFITNLVLRDSELSTQSKTFIYYEILHKFSEVGRGQNMDVLGAAMIEHYVNSQLDQSKIDAEEAERCISLLDIIKSVAPSASKEQAFHRLKPDKLADDADFNEFVGNAPSACHEVVEILLRTYLSRSQTQKISAIISLMGVLKIIPSTRIFNAWLIFSLNKRRLDPVTETYLTTMQSFPNSVIPDNKTIEILFRFATVQAKSLSPSQNKTNAQPRLIFSQMVKYRGESRFTYTTYNQMCRAFTKARDYNGLFVAIHACNSYFGLKPTIAAARNLVYLSAVRNQRNGDLPSRFRANQHIGKVYFGDIFSPRWSFKASGRDVKKNRSRWIRKLVRCGKKDTPRYQELKKVIRRLIEEDRMAKAHKTLESATDDSEDTKAQRSQFVSVKSISTFYEDMFLKGRLNSDKFQSVEEAAKFMGIPYPSFLGTLNSS